VEQKAPVVGHIGADVREGARARGQALLCQRWPQMREHARMWWGELTEEDLDEVYGQCDRLVNVIHRRYGGSRSEAEVEVNRFLIRAERLVMAPS